MNSMKSVSVMCTFYSFFFFFVLFCCDLLKKAQIQSVTHTKDSSNKHPFWNLLNLLIEHEHISDTLGVKDVIEDVKIFQKVWLWMCKNFIHLTLYS